MGVVGYLFKQCFVPAFTKPLAKLDLVQIKVNCIVHFSLMLSILITTKLVKANDCVAFFFCKRYT